MADKNIFHTKCISHGKVYDVIINGSSFENMVVYRNGEQIKPEDREASLTL